jgi:hypothetical protein
VSLKINPETSIMLQVGDCTRLKTFNLAVPSDTGVTTFGLKADRGYEFVAMFLGMAKKGERADVDKMIAQMGLVPNDGGAAEILHLKGVIADLEAKLAAKG